MHVMGNSPFGWLFISLTVMCISCSNVNKDGIPVSVLLEETQCPYSTEQKRGFNDKQAVAQFLDATPVFKTKIPMQGLATDAAKIGDQNTFRSRVDSVINEIDFDKSTVILVARGTQANPGYGLSTISEPASLEEGTLYLPVQYDSPDPDKMYPQMVISPCLLLALSTVWQAGEIAVQE